MIESVRKAMKILTVIADNGGQPLPLGEISARVGINKATCAHIVDTLVCEGFLVKISPTKGYITGPAAYCLSRFGRYGSDLISVCRPVMNYLYNTLGHCVVLAVIQGSTKYVIDYIDDGQIFESKQKIRKDDIYRTATGRVILENMSDEQIHAIWQKYGKPTKAHWAEIETVDDLLGYRNNAAKAEVIATRMENRDGSIHYGYAAPIKSGIRCMGALGVAVKLSADQEKAFLEQQENNIKNLLSKGAALVSKRI